VIESLASVSYSHSTVGNNCEPVVYDFRDKASYWPKIAIFSYPSAFPRLNIAVSFGTEKLEWCGYPTVKNVGRHVKPFR